MHALSQSRMPTFQTCNKKYRGKNLVTWLHLTAKMRIFRALKNKDNWLLLFCTGLYTSFMYLNTVVWLKSTDNHLSPMRNQKNVYLATLTLSFINVECNYVLEFLNSCGSNFVHIETIKTKGNSRYDIRYAVFHAFITAWKVSK